MTDVAYARVSVVATTQDRFTGSLWPEDGEPYVIRVDGTCPRCGHLVCQNEPLVLTTGFADVAREDRDAAARDAAQALREAGIDPAAHGSRDVVMTCECGTPHDGAPEGEHGCGAAWEVHVEW